MDATLINTVRTLSTSITQRTSKIPNVHGTSASRKHFFTTLSDHYLRRHTLLTVTHCSRKPNVTVESNSNLKTQIETTPTSNEETLSSSSSPSPCSNSSSSRGLVFDLGTINSWDSAELGSPVVKRFLGDEEERWYMWYHGKRNEGNLNPDSVGLAFSSNGIHWERGTGAVQSSSEAGLVLNCSKDWWAFDTESVRPSEVVIMSSAKVRASSAVYWLYYTGFISKIVEEVYSPLGSKVLKSLPGRTLFWIYLFGNNVFRKPMNSAAQLLY